jgi:hypothetical protein
MARSKFFLDRRFATYEIVEMHAFFLERASLELRVGIGIVGETIIKRFQAMDAENPPKVDYYLEPLPLVPR